MQGRGRGEEGVVNIFRSLKSLKKAPPEGRHVAALHSAIKYTVGTLSTLHTPFSVPINSANCSDDMSRVAAHSYTGRMSRRFCG